MNIIVLGAFFGDEGKGQTVHNLCKEYSNPIVVRFSGGHQVGHTVKNRNIIHTFSNFGSGTLLGVPTYWSQYCTVDPIATIEELKDLNKIGIFPSIIYNPLCELVTPFDLIHQWNDSENLKHGTVGTGYKATLDRVRNGYHLTVADCNNLSILRYKLLSIMNNYYNISSKYPVIDINKWCYKTYMYFRTVSIRNIEYLNNYNTKIFEGSQGILLDQTFGIMPHCTPSNTTSQNAIEIISKLKDSLIEKYYVCRPYITRHGNGPIPTSAPVIQVEDEYNKYNQFQGSLRAVTFDVRLLNHSITVDRIFGDAPVHIRITHSDELSEELLNTLKSIFCSYSLSTSYYEKVTTIL